MTSTQIETPPEIVYSCEICGQDGLSETQMRSHMESVHLKGAVQCPFCDLSSHDVTANEMTLHVNSAHLEYLTPEREDVAFLEDEEDFDSIWQLEKGAKEGLTSGIDDSPIIDNSKNLNMIKKSMDSPMSTSTEVSEVSMSSPAHSTASSSNFGAIQKRFKNSNSANNSPSKNGLSLNIRPSWAPLAVGSTSSLNSSLESELLKCPLCQHKCKEPSKLEEHVNRVHFDPESPMAASVEQPAAAAGASKMNLNNADVTPSSLPCPLCTAYYATSLELERHVNRDHTDVLSPMTTKRRPSTSSSSTTSLPRDVAKITGTTTVTAANNGNLECPVCNVAAFDNQNQLAEHIDGHFTRHPPKSYFRGQSDGQSISSMSSSSSSSSSSAAAVGHNQKHNDYLLAQELERRERERRKHEEQREFDQLRAQFGMDNDGNFHSQSISSMQSAVYRGEMSVVDYYERQSELRNAEKHGMDDGRSQTKHLMPRLKGICQTSAHGVAQTFLCSVVDHCSSSFGDKGWGCGYRNLQMLLSSLSHYTAYSERLNITKGQGVASISRLQSQIEAAWAKGFDVQGSEQLGNKLVNTRKWIGATEIVAFFSANMIKTELLDFHTPSNAKDGTHPKLFQWVLEYFRDLARAKAFTPPLYLQHQGHSRTIVGIEVLSSTASGAASAASGNNLRLLVFDPSHSKSHMATLLKSSPTSSEAGQVMRMLRKSPSAIKCKQYQIVAVSGVFASDKEAAAHKVIRSRRVP